MKITLLFVGKTTEPFVREGLELYLKRLRHYISISVEVVESSKFGKSGIEESITKETERLSKKINPGDFVIMLDKEGKSLTSEDLASFIEHSAHTRVQKLVFIVGGAYGVSKKLKDKANMTLSFSKFTFTHQMIRLLLAEQIYRAMTINRKEAYHH